MNATTNGQLNATLPTLALVRVPEQTAPAPARVAVVAPMARVADEESIRAIWREHGTALTRFALKLTLGDRQRAEDIVQETLVRTWRHPEVAGGDPKAIRPWLFTVTRHVAIDMWRSRSRCEEVLGDEPADRPDPAEPIEQAMTALDVRAALARLSVEHRQVIVGMYYQGQTVSELAERLGIPEGTVKSRAYYGLRHLKRALSAASAEGHVGLQAAPTTSPARVPTPAPDLIPAPPAARVPVPTPAQALRRAAQHPALCQASA
jgi:RNA polymerase sigma-70 factor (ECF subfamily)